MRFLPIMAATLLLLPAQARADTTLDTLVRAMGADKVKSVRYSGSGFVYAVGQSHRPGDPWPKFRVNSFSISADYDGVTLAQDMHVTQYLNPPHGGGRQPLVQGGERRRLWLKGDAAWTPVAVTFVASPAARSDALHTLWTSPHGVIKAAQAQNATVGGRAGARTVAFESKGNFRAVAVFGERDRLERVETRMPNAVLGDMLVVTTYSGYRQFSGIPFPTRIDVTTNGHPSLELRIAKVEPNAAVEVAVPATLGRPRVNVTVDKAADGVWFVAGGSHHSIAVEMSDHVVVIEGPQNDGRANAVIDAVKRTIPGKPIRHVVATHHHFDHSGGLRAFVAEGATVVAQRMTAAYLEAAYAAPWTVRPDRMARSGRSARFVGFDDKHVLGDSSRTIELHRLQGNGHAADLVIAYLPREKIMIVADAFSPRQLMKGPAQRVNPSTANLWQNVERLKLDIATILPIHGQKVGLDQLQMAAGKKPGM